MHTEDFNTCLHMQKHTTVQTAMHPYLNSHHCSREALESLIKYSARGMTGWEEKKKKKKKECFHTEPTEYLHIHTYLADDHRCLRLLIRTA